MRHTKRPKTAELVTSLNAFYVTKVLSFESSQALTAVHFRTPLFRDVTLRRCVTGSRRFEGTRSLHL